MRHSLFFVALATFLAAGYSTKAQEEESERTPREIIIQQHDGDSAKTVIEIKGDKVTVNGKPVDEWKGGEVTIVPRINVWKDGNLYLNFSSGPRLGVYTQSSDKGARITKVTDSSAAAKGGLEVGDVITKVDDAAVSDPSDLSAAIHSHSAGDKVTIHYLRGDQEHTTDVTLQEGKNEMASAYGFPGLDKMPKLDFKEFGQPFRSAWAPFIGPRLGARIQDTQDDNGAKVLSVDPESPAAGSGLQKGDVIKEVDGQKVTDTDGVLDALRDNADKNTHSITVDRDGKTMTLEAKVPRKLKTATF